MPPEIIIRPIAQSDNPTIAQVIRTVSAEYGLTADRGFSVADPQLDDLYSVYSQPGCVYWLVELNGEIAGGAGIAPLDGADADVCELQKMYFLPVLRGKGIAKRLAEQLFDYARRQGFKRCYLETTACLSEAVKLYEKLGFDYLDEALGCTGHSDCEIRMIKTL